MPAIANCRMDCFSFLSRSLDLISLNLARTLLASRMDAPIVGRRFIAGANGTTAPESPVRDD